MFPVTNVDYALCAFEGTVVVNCRGRHDAGCDSEIRTNHLNAAAGHGGNRARLGIKNGVQDPSRFSIESSFAVVSVQRGKKLPSKLLVGTWRYTGFAD